MSCTGAPADEKAANRIIDAEYDPQGTFDVEGLAGTAGTHPEQDCADRKPADTAPPPALAHQNGGNEQ